MEKAVSSSPQNVSSSRVKGMFLRVALKTNSRPSVRTGREMVCPSCRGRSDTGERATSAPPRKELMLPLIASKIVIGIGPVPPRDTGRQDYTLPLVMNATVHL